jgi:hypothetical protein
MQVAEAKKLNHLIRAAQLFSLLRQPGRPPPADPWLSVPQLLGVWRYLEQILTNSTTYNANHSNVFCFFCSIILSAICRENFRKIFIFSFVFTGG